MPGRVLPCTTRFQPKEPGRRPSSSTRLPPTAPPQALDAGSDRSKPPAASTLAGNDLSPADLLEWILEDADKPKTDQANMAYGSRIANGMTTARAFTEKRTDGSTVNRILLDSENYHKPALQSVSILYDPNASHQSLAKARQHLCMLWAERGYTIIATPLSIREQKRRADGHVDGHLVNDLAERFRQALRDYPAFFWGIVDHINRFRGNSKARDSEYTWNQWTTSLGEGRGRIPGYDQHVDTLVRKWFELDQDWHSYEAFSRPFVVFKQCEGCHERQQMFGVQRPRELLMRRGERAVVDLRTKTKAGIGGGVFLCMQGDNPCHKDDVFRRVMTGKPLFVEMKSDALQ